MKLVRKIIVFILFGMLATVQLHAKEGMYLLSDIPELMPQLITAGCECTSQQIYSADGASLANQVPHFGRGCTSEIVSANGLLLTNYHCAHGNIQSVSSVEHDYLTNGFWAKKYEEELPVEGLSVRVPVKVVDVSKEIKAQISGLDGEEKDKKLSEIISQMVQYEKSKSRDRYVIVREMLGGTKYVLFVSRTFRDVRLVGVPPVSLGKFGGDRDNWTWPRHTADFTFLRIYGDVDGNPAAYSKANKPLSTPYHIKVSTEGVKDNDFVFILGYPGSTDRYATSFEVEERQNIINAIRYKVRTEKLAVIESQMAKNDTIRIKYSAKHAGVSNYWKHAKAQNGAFEKLDVVGQKRQKELDFKRWVNQTPERQKEYGKVFLNIQEAIEGRKKLMKEFILGREALFGMDLVRFLRSIHNDEYIFDDKNRAEVEEYVAGFYKNIDVETETKIIAALLEQYFENTDDNRLEGILDIINTKYNGDYEKYAEDIVQHSPFKNLEGYKRVVFENKDKKAIESDNLAGLAKLIADAFKELQGEMGEYARAFYENQYLYKKGIAESATELLAPDANSTIRLTYGHVKSLDIDENTSYPHYTTVDGVMKKYQSDSSYYRLPKEFISLYKNKDFGRYAVDGKVPACFIATTHTTGGNSGSPVFDAKGGLVGLLFDGNSEGLSGDYQFDEGLVRSIVVDIRYVLFITEKLGKSSHIIDDLGLGKTVNLPAKTEK